MKTNKKGKEKTEKILKEKQWLLLHVMKVCPGVSIKIMKNIFREN
jgi:hypothetical protein